MKYLIRNPDMKYLISSVTIGACLLLSSGGAALANGSEHPNSGTLGTGQPGGTGGAQCGTTDNNINAMNLPPGQAGTTPNGGMSSSNNSPFLATSKSYAGSNGVASNAMSGNAFSNYDVACSQSRPGQLH
jgi:hypothetical protein